MNLRPLLKIIARVLTRSQLFVAVLFSAMIIVFFFLSFSVMGLSVPDSISSFIFKIMGSEIQIDEYDIFSWYIKISLLFGFLFEMLYGLRILKRSKQTAFRIWKKKLKGIALLLGSMSIVGSILISISNGEYVKNTFIFFMFWVIAIASWAWYLFINSLVEYILDKGVWVSNINSQ